MKLREIAARLAEAAATLPDVNPDTLKYRDGNTIEFRFGTLVIRCLRCQASVRAVATKYERGVVSLRAGQRLPSRNLPGKASLRRPADAEAMLAALADAEPSIPAQEAA